MACVQQRVGNIHHIACHTVSMCQCKKCNRSVYLRLILFNTQKHCKEDDFLRRKRNFQLFLQEAHDFHCHMIFIRIFTENVIDVCIQLMLLTLVFHQRGYMQRHCRIHLFGNRIAKSLLSQLQGNLYCMIYMNRYNFVKHCFTPGFLNLIA